MVEKKKKKKRMLTSSIKAKGRDGQKEISKDLFTRYNLDPNDFKWCSMGAQGADIIMSRAAKEKFPFSIEVKREEKLRLYKAISQAEANGEIDKLPSIVVFRKNKDKWRVVVDWDIFLKMNDAYIKEK